jgi:hypothetical protein
MATSTSRSADQNPSEHTRAVTPLEEDGVRVAVLVHDPAVIDDPALLPAVGAAARLAVSTARLQAEVSARVGEVFAAAAELVAGYALLGVGVAATMRARQARLGAILVGASFAWFLVEWNSPAAGSALVITAGIVSYAAAPPLVAHVMLAYPDGRVGWWPGRIGLALSYAGSVLVLGLAAAAVFNPAIAGCAQCPGNLLHLRATGRGDLADRYPDLGARSPRPRKEIPPPQPGASTYAWSAVASASTSVPSPEPGPCKRVRGVESHWLDH